MALSRAQKEKIRKIKRGYEQKGLREIKGIDGVWRPNTIGEVLEGEYLEFEENADSYNRNKYTFTDNGQLKDSSGKPVGLEGRVSIFGSVTLDDKMKRIPIGASVAIIFCGEKINQGVKNPTKLFTVMSDNEEEPEEETNSSEIMPQDDPMARDLIKDCETFLDSEGKKNPSILDIANYAQKILQEDDNPDEQLLDQVHTILARDLIAECALSLTNDDNLSPSEEEVAECAKKMLENKNRPLLTKVQLLLAEIVKSKKK